jgi:hypothetical protein
MIPAFTEQGFLPPGVYQATLDEFKERFVVFQRSDRRFRLFVQLEKLLDQAAQARIVKRILIAGSFVSAKPEPNDFDCIVVLDPSIGSCTSSLRVIRSPANPVQYPFHHLCEGTLLWYPTSFSTSSR